MENSANRNTIVSNDSSSSVDLEKVRVFETYRGVDISILELADASIVDLGDSNFTIKNTGKMSYMAHSRLGSVIANSTEHLLDMMHTLIDRQLNDVK